MNYYDILGVSRDATTEEITAAFKRLVRELHPDRFSTEEEKRKAEKRFQEITRAFNTLKDPEKREEYDKTLNDHTFVSSTSSQSSTQINSDDLFKKGLMLYKNEDYESAESYFQAAIKRGMSTAECYYYLALTQMKLPRRSKKVIENLEQAINLDPLNLKYRLALADFFLEKGVKTKAIYHYKRALKLDPKNQRVINVLRQLGLVKEKSFFQKLISSIFRRS